MTDQPRADPVSALTVGEAANLRRKRGKLRLFLGMAPGVGKTCAMLQSAREERRSGRDVVIGHVATHGTKFTDTLAEGLPRIPPRRAAPGDAATAEMDLDSVLARQPHVVVVDELAHGNAPGSRHPQRHQDVLELLDAGIDVYATLNVYEVASRADAAHQITGLPIREVVPDLMLDGAEIEMVNLPPDKLVKRVRENLVHLSQNPEFARIHFFSEGNLLALREMALRLTAARAGKETEDFVRAKQLRQPWKAGHRLLAGIGPDANSEAVIRWTKRLADSLNCPWAALYVELPPALDSAAQAQLTRNLDLARELGAEVITTTDFDIVQGLLRVASQRNATEVVIGNPRPKSSRRLSPRASISSRLLRESGEIVVHAIPTDHPSSALPRIGRRLGARPAMTQYALVAVVIGLITLGASALAPLMGAHAVALIYLLAVVVLALFVNRGPTLIAAALSALFWEYFILPPVFAFRISNFEDAMLLGMYFVVALVLGELTARIRAQEAAERRREERATALFVLIRELAEETDLDQMLHKVVRDMESVFNARVVVLLPAASGGLGQPHPASTFTMAVDAPAVAAWVLEHGQPAGQFTDNLPGADAMYLPLTSGGGAVGILGLRLAQTSPPTIHQRNLLETFARQIALALDRHRLRANSEHAKLLAASEHLSKTLLDSISHEIRTPLAAIQGATGALAAFEETAGSQRQQAMIAEIQEATGRLDRLVGNVLDITRLESGTVKPRLNECDVHDLVNVAVAETERELARHQLTVVISPRLPLVQMDFVLTQQALMNLLANAAIHTPAGTPVQISAHVEQTALILQVADRGPGLPPESLPRAFEKFYRGPQAPTGGTGLGLSLVKGFIEAQGGHVKAANRLGGGASFTISLPLDRSLAPSPEANL